MSVELITLYILLQIKHWYIDFASQTKNELEHKGIYGSVQGMTHSLKHGIATLFCILAITGQAYFLYAMVLAIIDTILHYHIDWAKQQLNKGLTTADRMFWVWFGADQGLHYLTYIAIIGWTVTLL
jgi:hypothetical protein